MIYVKRDIPVPKELKTPRAKRYEQQVRDYFLNPDAKQRSQQRYDFEKNSVWLRMKLIPTLMKLFNDKCAFCETRRLGLKGEPDLEHFRPKGGAVDLDGRRAPDHYWWLAFDWDNLYPACPFCNRSKGSRFPVKDGQRAPVNAGRSDLREEPALLLDPCLDLPEDHLVFAADGTVAAVHYDDLPTLEQQRFGTPTRGQVTIDTFSLNRKDLIDDRRKAADHLMSLVASNAPTEEIHALLEPDQPFLQLKRQLLKFSEVEAAQISASADSPAQDGQADIASKAFKAGRDRAFQQQAAWEDQLTQTSVEKVSEASQYRARAVYIDRVEIRGFTSMKEFDFNFSHPESASDGGAPWLMLLGENGVGKTSVLKAIALALAGRRRLNELQEEATMQGLPELFQENGIVRVFLTSQNEPLEIFRKGDRLECSGDADGAKAFVRAFGPSRWFPTPNSQPPETDDFVRIENLFNPFVPLESGEDYLAMLDDERWEDIATGLKDLLQIPGAGMLSKTDGAIRVELPGEEPKSLRALSSGFEAVLAMSADLIHLLYQRWSSLADAEGIVLLDEIGAHLHPRWRMRIVECLRRTFPRVQFLATTHEPLCLRGLRQAEILVMQRQAEELDSPSVVIPMRPTQDVSDLRIDQLLTSRLFGLHSTLDPDLEDEFDRYYSLLSRHKSALSDDDREELEFLKDTVGARGILGNTRRDQMIYQIIDKFVATEFTHDSEEQRVESERLTKEQVAAFWTNIPDAAEADPEAEA